MPFTRGVIGVFGYSKTENTMINPSEHIWKLISGKLAGELDQDEELELRLWLDSKSQHQQFFDEIQTIWEQASVVEARNSSVDKAWQEVNELLDRREQPRLSEWFSKANLRAQVNIKWLTAASLLTVVVVLGAYLLNIGSHDQVSAESTVDSTASESLPGYSMEFVVTEDSLKSVRLPDGTKVWLNESSQISYGKTFNRIIREVHLQGEAYFEVRRDSLRPFIIRAGQSETRVLGTSFNLKAYSQSYPELTVVTGRVTFSQEDSDKLLVLSAGEQGILNEQAGQLIKRQNQDPHFLDWKHALVYKEEISHPAEYLSEKFHKKKSAINQTEIDGIIYNHATLATYKNIKLRVQYFHKKKERMKSHVFTVYKSIGPGEAIDYRYRLADWFSQTDQLQIRVVDATVTKN